MRRSGVFMIQELADYATLAAAVEERELPMASALV